MAVTAGKTDIIDAVAEKTGLTKKDAQSAVDAMLEAIVDSLQRGERVQLTGFGTFETRERKERKGSNIQTGEEIIIPASTVPAFKPGKALRDAVK
ncbi:MAG: HU family DNA-binding protein [candidate division WS1 bacterium]|jgi:DNA-binding protein HU-beta|nr:HU family DNA-binding protein [candidate division WS1 bacterium]